MPLHADSTFNNKGSSLRVPPDLYLFFKLEDNSEKLISHFGPNLLPIFLSRLHSVPGRGKQDVIFIACRSGTSSVISGSICVTEKTNTPLGWSVARVSRTLFVSVSYARASDN